MRRKGMKRLAAFLALSLMLAGITPAMQVEAASLYKKFPTYTRYENKFGKAGMTADNGALENLLAAKTYKYVYLRNIKTAEKYTIPANSKFAGKRLRINAPLSKVVNHANSMKVVKITEVESWTEYGKGNSFAVVDENAKFEVGTGSTVDKLYFQADGGKVALDVKGDVKKAGFYGDKMDAAVTISQGTTQEFRVAAENSKVDVTVEKAAEINTVKVVKDANVTLNVNNAVEKVVLDAAANVTITGDSEKVKEVTVEVGGKAEGAKVTSDVPVKLEVKAKADITLKEGAEGSTVKKADEKVEVEVKNETKKDVTVSTEGTTKTETVPSTNKDTTGGGTTGGGTTGGGSSSGGSTGGGTYYPPTGGGNTGGGDTPNPPVTPTITPAAITAAVSVSGSSVGSTSATGSNGTLAATITASLPAVIKIELTGIDVASIKAITFDGTSLTPATTIGGEITEEKDVVVVITETNDAKTTLTITVKAIVKDKDNNITRNLTEYTANFDTTSKFAYALYDISDMSGATISEGGVSERITLDNGKIKVKVTTDTSEEKTVILKPSNAESGIVVGNTTAASVTLTFTPPSVDSVVEKVTAKTIKTPGIVEYVGDGAYKSYAIYSQADVGKETYLAISGTAIRHSDKAEDRAVVSGSGLIAVATAAEDMTDTTSVAVYYTKDSGLYRWWDAENACAGVDADDQIHDILLNHPDSAGNRDYYILTSKGELYKAELSSSNTAIKKGDATHDENKKTE